ncbi:PE family protein [Mycobacterium sp. 012931]|nr:PE family protein [Mycobacterium sp. 012931]
MAFIVAKDGPMTYVITQPDILTTAAADIADIRSAIGMANAAAASPTTAMMAAAGDEVSQLIAKLFSAYGQECQAVITDAAVFHDHFAATLAAAGSVYTQAEAAGAATLSQALTTLSSPIRALLGGTAASTSGAMAAAAPMPQPGTRSTPWSSAAAETRSRRPPTSAMLFPNSSRRIFRSTRPWFRGCSHPPSSTSIPVSRPCPSTCRSPRA